VAVVKINNAQSAYMLEPMVVLVSCQTESEVVIEQIIAAEFHMPVYQRRDKELHLFASETCALLVFICGKL
jgi:hypothetical protein